MVSTQVSNRRRKFPKFPTKNLGEMESGPEFYLFMIIVKYYRMTQKVNEFGKVATTLETMAATTQAIVLRKKGNGLW